MGEAISKTHFRVKKDRCYIHKVIRWRAVHMLFKKLCCEVYIVVGWMLYSVITKFVNSGCKVN